jgi:hypothetical protein
MSKLERLLMIVAGVVNVLLYFNRMKKSLICVGIPALMSLMCFGCGSTATIQNTSALQITAARDIQAGNYTILTVMPFTLSEDAAQADKKFGENFSGDIVARFRSDYPALFQDVRWNKSNRVPNEAILEGTIKVYKPGSRTARFLVGPFVGASSFEGDFVLKDAKDGRIIFAAPFDKLWAWGGMLGTHKTIENMISETAVAITKTVALWKQGQLDKE